jgi:hypothetical protein
MFQLTEATEAALASITTRTEKHGDEDVPAVSLSLSIDCANTMLDLIDPKIRHALYTAIEDQEQLPGIEPATPVLRCNSFDTIALTTAHEGWTLEVDDSIDEAAPMVFGGCKVDKFRVDAKQGGSVTLRIRVGTSDLDAERLGALGMHNGRLIWVRLLAPKIKAPAIDGSVGAFERDHPEAGDLFAAGADNGEPGPQDDDSDGADTEAGTPDVGDAALAEAATREQAELEAGMAQAMAAAGVKPSRRATPQQSKPVGLE